MKLYFFAGKEKIMLWNMTAAAGAFPAPGALNRGVTMSWFDSRSQREQAFFNLAFEETVGREARRDQMNHPETAEAVRHAGEEVRRQLELAPKNG